MNPESLTHRIEALERSNRRLRGGLVAGALGACALILLGANHEEGDPKTIELKDGDKVRISLQMKGDGPALLMYDRHGDPSIELSVGRDGPEFHMRGDHGSSRVAITANRDDTMLTLGDHSGKARAELAVEGSARTELALSDWRHRKRASLSYVRGKTPVVKLYDEKGQELWPGGGAQKVIR